MVELVAQGYCTTWVGIALLSCQCNTVLSGALVPYLVHCFVVMKPLTPFRAGVSAGGFIGQLGEASIGVGGFTWTT